MLGLTLFATPVEAKRWGKDDLKRVRTIAVVSLDSLQGYEKICNSG